ncbi:MAG: ThuA domain-containing protein [Saprospiraceae bacterium]|nr:ThuA domain-containing protein [Saprospiraceae bacterium]
MKLRIISILILCFIVLISFTDSTLVSAQDSKKKLQALIIDGENNHGAWPKTTMMLRDYLLQTGLFAVDIERKAFTWQGPHNDASQGGPENRMKLLSQYSLPGSKTTMVEEPKVDPDFAPDFSKYDVVISHLGWKATDWPDKTKQAFEDYVMSGGGVVIVHAANNSFGDWHAYNRMIGLGGWGDRTEEDGPYVYYDESGKLIRDTGPGNCGSHGPQQEFVITMRDQNHPITRGIPGQWLHAQDELYDRLRGPAEKMTVLATAYSDEEKNTAPWSGQEGTNRHEPMLLTVDYGKGRVFHTVMGHTDYSMECVGFIVTLQRGTEWAAIGKVTLTDLPYDFPGLESVSQRKWQSKMSKSE